MGNDKQEIEELRAEIKKLKQKLKEATATNQLTTYVTEIPYTEVGDVNDFWIENDHAKDLLIGKEAYRVSIHPSWSNNAYEELRKVCLLAFKRAGDKNRPKVKELTPEQLELTGEMITELAKVYNKYFVEIRKRWPRGRRIEDED